MGSSSSLVTAVPGIMAENQSTDFLCCASVLVLSAACLSAKDFVIHHRSPRDNGRKSVYWLIMLYICIGLVCCLSIVSRFVFVTRHHSLGDNGRIPEYWLLMLCICIGLVCCLSIFYRLVLITAENETNEYWITDRWLVLLCNCIGLPVSWSVI